MINLSVVSYTNAYPFVHALKNNTLNTPIDFTIAPPNIVAKQLLNNEIDIGLVPIAILPKLAYAEYITDYGIGCNGAVKSVQLFSNKKLKDIKTIMLDIESNTSNKLCKILCYKYWNLDIAFVTHEPADAQIIIGDRALAAINKFTYAFDLGDAWKSFTGLPFVFAAWIANKPLDINFSNALNSIFEKSINSMEILVKEKFKNEPSIQEYLLKNIKYQIGIKELEAIKLFLSITI